MTQELNNLYPSMGDKTDSGKTDSDGGKADDKATDKTDDKATDKTQADDKLTVDDAATKDDSKADDKATDKKDGDDKSKTDDADKGKKDDDKKDDKKDGDKKDDEPEFKPYTLEAKEGTNKQMLEGFNKFAVDHKIPQDKAEAFAGEFQKAQLEAVEAQSNTWLTEAKADKEIGGAKFKESCDLAKEAIKKFGGDELHDLLDMTRLGNHPLVIKTFSKIGKTLSEGKALPPAEGAKQGGDALSTMYPSMAKSK